MRSLGRCGLLFFVCQISVSFAQEVKLALDVELPVRQELAHDILMAFPLVDEFFDITGTRKETKFGDQDGQSQEEAFSVFLPRNFDIRLDGAYESGGRWTAVTYFSHCSTRSYVLNPKQPDNWHGSIETNARSRLEIPFRCFGHRLPIRASLPQWTIDWYGEEVHLLDLVFHPNCLVEKRDGHSWRLSHRIYDPNRVFDIQFGDRMVTILEKNQSSVAIRYREMVWKAQKGKQAYPHRYRAWKTDTKGQLVSESLVCIDHCMSVPVTEVENRFDFAAYEEKVGGFSDARTHLVNNATEVWRCSHDYIRLDRDKLLGVFRIRHSESESRVKIDVQEVTRSQGAPDGAVLIKQLAEPSQVSDQFRGLEESQLVVFSVAENPAVAQPEFSYSIEYEVKISDTENGGEETHKLVVTRPGSWSMRSEVGVGQLGDAFLAAFGKGAISSNEYPHVPVGETEVYIPGATKYTIEEISKIHTKVYPMAMSRRPWDEVGEEFDGLGVFLSQKGNTTWFKNAEGEVLYRLDAPYFIATDAIRSDNRRFLMFEVSRMSERATPQAYGYGYSSLLRFELLFDLEGDSEFSHEVSELMKVAELPEIKDEVPFGFSFNSLLNDGRTVRGRRRLVKQINEGSWQYYQNWQIWDVEEQEMLADFGAVDKDGLDK